MMVEKTQPVSVGLFPSLPVRQVFSFTNWLKDWEENLPHHLLREVLVEKKKEKSKLGRVGSDEVFIWLVHGTVQTLHAPFTSKLGTSFCSSNQSLPYFPSGTLIFT